MVSVDRDAPLVMQGRDLLHAYVSALYRIGSAIEEKW